MNFSINDSLAGIDFRFLQINCTDKWKPRIVIDFGRFVWQIMSALSYVCHLEFVSYGNLFVLWFVLALIQSGTLYGIDVFDLLVQ